MKISVALCTYNGARFLHAQLDSIARQTRPPDEIVICDDASTDGTGTLVRQYRSRMPCAVRIEVNPSNLGSTENFARAIGLCTGDAIALADQDDVWRPHKLATLEAAFTEYPGVGFVFSDAEVVDEQLNSVGYTLWDAIRFGSWEQERFRRGRAFECLLRRYRVTGATTAFRSEYRDRILPIPADWVHDAWIALLIAATAPCALVPAPLIQYRQHADQQHGGARRGLYAQYLAAKRITRETCEAVAARYAAALHRLGGVPGVPAERLRRLADKVEHHRRRAAMRTPGAWRLPRVVREIWLGNYRRYSLGWKAAAQDLFLG